MRPILVFMGIMRHQTPLELHCVDSSEHRNIGVTVRCFDDSTQHNFLVHWTADRSAKGQWNYFLASFEGHSSYKTLSYIFVISIKKIEKTWGMWTCEVSRAFCQARTLHFWRVVPRYFAWQNHLQLADIRMTLLVHSWLLRRQQKVDKKWTWLDNTYLVLPSRSRRDYI